MSLSTFVVLVAALAASVPDFATSTSASVARAGITNELALGVALGLCLACVLLGRVSRGASVAGPRTKSDKSMTCLETSGSHPLPSERQQAKWPRIQGGYSAILYKSSISQSLLAGSLALSVGLVVFQLACVVGQASLPDWDYLSVQPAMALVDRALRVAVVGAAALFVCVHGAAARVDAADTALACPIALALVAGVCCHALSWCTLHVEGGPLAVLTNTELSLVGWALTALCYGLVALASLRLGAPMEGWVVLASFVGGELVANALLRVADTLAVAGASPQVLALGWQALPLLALVAIVALALTLLWARRHAAWRSEDGVPDEAGQPRGVAGSDDALRSLVGYGALSLREREVLGLDLAGKKTAAIAEELGISRSSIATHRSRAYEKLGVASRQELLAELFDRRVYGERGGDASARHDASAPARPVSFVRPALVAGAALLCAHALPRWFTSLAPLVVAAALYLQGLMKLGAGTGALTASVSPREALGVTGLVGATVTLASSPELGIIVVAVPVLVLSSLALGSSARTALTQNGLALVAGGAAGLVATPAVSPATATQALTLACLAACSALAVVSARRERHREQASVADLALTGQDRVLSYLRGRGLTDLEAQVTLLTASGFDVGGIAARLYVSAHTVATYRARSYAKLDVTDKAALRDLLQREASLE